MEDNRLRVIFADVKSGTLLKKAQIEIHIVKRQMYTKWTADHDCNNT